MSCLSQKAIEFGEENGHEGRAEDGRLWRSEELKAARKLLPEARMWQASSSILPRWDQRTAIGTTKLPSSF
ncbi:MAG: hypothetical protein SGPRY_007802, partial [Prymnesium sp.]